MSTPLDPALQQSARGGEYQRHTSLRVVPEAVYVFDFDGVLASRLEDDVYRLPPVAEEQALLAVLAERFHIACAGMEARYRRHLVYQAACWRLDRSIEPGPCLGLARQANRQARLFIITARSGWYAVERCRRFLEAHDLRPVELYNVGRVDKAAQLALLAREFPERPIHFVEDSSAHLQSAVASGIPNLVPVLVSPMTPALSGPALRQHLMETLAAANHHQE